MSNGSTSPSRFRFSNLNNAFSLFGFMLLLLPSSLAAQVAVIPSSPTYNIQVLPGSTRQINVNITGGSSNTVNWSVLSATGGASATFTTPAASDVSTVTAGLPTVLVNIGQGTGNCSIPQAVNQIGKYSVTSTATVTVQAQSVDDPTKTGAFLFNVCAKTTTVMIAPAYQQAFMGQHRTLQSWISGDTDETGTWTIASQPSGGDAVLADTTNRDTDFVATATGRYTLLYTSNSDPSKSATAIVYVSPNPLPAYVSTPNKTEPRECFPDPAFTGGDYEVGAGKQYPSLESTPASGTLKPGSIIRVWNTDTTGSNPSTYHEYYQIAAHGLATQPLILCGVPDSLGNLPVIDGSNATGQASVTNNGAAAGAGVISVWPGGGTPYGYWQSGSAGPEYVTVTGLHIAHGTPNYTYTPPGGGAATAYQQFTSCLNIRSGSYIDLGGNHLDTCGLGLFTADNGNNGWASITQLVTMTGSHVQNAGISGQNEEHGAYVQSWYALLQGNLFDNYNPQASGSDIKWRGVEGIFRYNNLASGASRLFDLVDIQDADLYISFESYLSSPGDTNCNNSMYCLGDKAGPNILAANQESFQKDFVYGNELWGKSTLQQIHYLADSSSGMQARNGTLYFFSNTLDTAQIVFDNGSNGDGYYGYFPPRVDARNNILWASKAPYKGAQIQMAFATTSTIIMSATTNLMKTGTFTIQPPIMGAAWQNNTDEGWSNGCDGACKWPLSIPLDPHLYGLSDANYLTTASQPYDPTTMVPPAGSAAINAGSALTDILQAMPVRWQYSIATNSLIPRLNPQTIGAVDYAAEAVAPTFSPSGGDYSTAPTVSIETTTPSANIYYTTDGSTPTFPATGTTQLYSGPISVAASETVQAISTANGYEQSSVASATYGIGPLADTPVFSPAGGTFVAVQTVTISDAAPGATIYYTSDGTTPSTGSAVYSGPITVSNNEVVQAIAAAPGYSNSSVGSAAFTINVPQTALPAFTPAGGTYATSQTVTISDATAGATIYYTTNGTTPTAASNPYTGPITVSASETIQAIAIASGNSNSAVGSAVFTINAGQTASPTFTPAGGTYSASQVVTISDATPGALIYFTTNGTIPTPASILYTGPITVFNSETIQAIAIASGSSNSGVASAAFTIAAAQTASPTFTPATGTYSSIQTVTISDATAGAFIYYTTDGTAPTAASTLYSGPITVSASETVQAIAIAAANSPSSVGRATYNIPLVFTGPAIAQQCNNMVQYAKKVSCTLTGIGAGHTLVIGIAGISPTNKGTMTATSGTPVQVVTDGNFLGAWILPNTSAGNNQIAFSVNSDARLWLSVVEYQNAAASPLDGVAQANLSTSWQSNGILNTPNFTTSSASDALWTFCNGVSAPPTVGVSPVAFTGLPNPQSSNLLVETGNTASAGVYHGQCASNEGEIVALALKPGGGLVQVATPAFSLASGAYASAQSVTISDATPGATIYYTADGTAPTIASTVYSGPITVSASETLQAIAASGSTAQSSIATAVYSINASGTTPTISWPTPAAITYGTPLSSAQLNATSTVAGSFSYSPASGVLTAGSHTLTATFTPTDTTDYNTATASVTLTVNQATPAITWPTPAAINLGVLLTSVQLNATTTVPGSFNYSPTFGALLAVGSQTLTATFTPTDTTDYSIATASVTLGVVSSGVSPSFVQQCNQYNQYGTTASCTLSAVGSGHTLVIGIAGGGTIPGTVTTNAGTPVLAVQDGSFLSAYVLANTGAGSITVTYNTASGSTRIHMSVAEYANVAANPVDNVASFVGKGNGATISTPGFTTTTASDLLWSYCGMPGGTLILPGNAPVVWQKRISPNGTGMPVLVEDAVTTGPGSYFGQCTEPGLQSEIVTIALKP
jgi:hypothetical protein